VYTTLYSLQYNVCEVYSMSHDSFDPVDALKFTFEKCLLDSDFFIK
jgi:hypothetical protein